MKKKNGYNFEKQSKLNVSVKQTDVQLFLSNSESGFTYPSGLRMGNSCLLSESVILDIVSLR
jgi:hypothetical protein